MADVSESGDLLGAFMAQPKFPSELQRVGMPEPRVELYDVERER